MFQQAIYKRSTQQQPRISFGTRRLCPVVIALAVYGIWSAIPGMPVFADDAVDDYLAAVGLYKQNRWSFAADAFAEYVKKYPNDPKRPYAQLYLGLSRINLQQYKEAREVLRDYLKRFPNSKEAAHAAYRVGECSYMLDDLPAAAAELAAFVKAHPDSSLCEWALPYLGDVQLRQGQAKAAEQTFRQALEKFPAGELAEDAKFGLARAVEQLGRNDEAVKLYRELTINRSGSRAPQAQLNLASLLFQQQNFDDAAAEFDRLPERFPESELVGVARLNAGYAYYRAGAFEKAAERFAQAADVERLATTARYWQGLAHKARGDYEAAAAVFRKAYRPDDDAPEMPEMLYHWADCERRLQHWSIAHDLFADFVRRHPQHRLADDSRLLAAECLLAAAVSTAGDERKTQLDRADKHIADLLRETPDTPLKQYAHLLRGRILLARSDAESAKNALTIFEAVIGETQQSSTRSQARILAARAAQQVGDHAKAVALLTPLLDAPATPETASVFAEAAMLAARSRIAEKQFDAATDLLTRLFERGGATPAQQREARSLQTIAHAGAGRWDEARAAWQAFEKSVAGDPAARKLRVETARETAEAAFAQKRWAEAAEFFQIVAAAPKELGRRPDGLSGLGWAQFEDGRFAAAAETFSRLVREFPQHELAAEAAYKAAESKLKDGRRDEAAAAFQDALRAYAPDPHAYLAGLQAARELGRLGQIDKADAVYEEILQRFPRPEKLDRLLDEWALLNLAAKRFDRADEIFRRLLKETPESDLADNARFSLAESDVQAGRIAEARAAFEALLQDPAADADVRKDSLLRLIVLDVQQAQWKSASERSDRFLKDFPNAPAADLAEVRFLRAQAQLQLDHTDAARRELLALKAELTAAGSDASAADPQWAPFVWLLLAEAEWRSKKYDAVRALAEEFAKRFPNSKEAYRMDELIARSFKQEARFDEAARYYERVLHSESGSRTETAAKAQFALADMQYIRKRFKEAIPLYLRVYHLYAFPEWQAAALYYAAVCDEQLKQFDDARRTYALLLEKFPQSEHAAKAEQRLKALANR